MELAAGADSEPMVRLVTDDASQALTCSVLLILMDHSDSAVPFTDLAARYRQIFAADLTITQLQNELVGFVEVEMNLLLAFFFNFLITPVVKIAGG